MFARVLLVFLQFAGLRALSRKSRLMGSFLRHLPKAESISLCASLAVVQHKVREANGVLEIDREMLTKGSLSLVGLNQLQEKHIYQRGFVLVKTPKTSFFSETVRGLCAQQTSTIHGAATAICCAKCLRIRTIAHRFSEGYPR